MVNLNKKNKRGNGDFKRIKAKVGKRVKSVNSTNTSFRSRQIYVPSQSILAEKGALVSAKGLSTSELLIQIKHYSGAVRREGLLGLKQIVGNYEGFAAAHFGRIFSPCLDLLADTENDVREMLLQLYQELFKEVGSECARALTPFADTAGVYAVNALTHLDLTVRRDAAKFIGMLLDACAQSLLGTCSEGLQKFLPSFVSLLGAEAQRHQRGSAQSNAKSTNKKGKKNKKQTKTGATDAGVLISYRAKAVKVVLSLLQKATVLAERNQRSNLLGDMVYTIEAEWTAKIAGRNAVLHFCPTAIAPAYPNATVMKPQDQLGIGVSSESVGGAVLQVAFKELWTRLKQLWEEALEREGNPADIQVLELVPQVFTQAMRISKLSSDCSQWMAHSLLGNSAALAGFFRQVIVAFPLHGSEGAGTDSLPTSLQWYSANLSIVTMATEAAQLYPEVVAEAEACSPVSRFMSELLSTATESVLFSQDDPASDTNKSAAERTFAALEVLLTKGRLQLDNASWKFLLTSLNSLESQIQGNTVLTVQFIGLVCNLIKYCLKQLENESDESSASNDPLAELTFPWLQWTLTKVPEYFVHNNQPTSHNFIDAITHALGATLEVAKLGNLIQRKTVGSEFLQWLVETSPSLINECVFERIPEKCQQLLVQIFNYLPTLSEGLLSEVLVVCCSSSISTSTRSFIVEVLHHRRKSLSPKAYLGVLVALIESCARIDDPTLFSESLANVSLLLRMMRGASQGLKLVTALSPTFVNLLQIPNAADAQGFNQRVALVLTCLCNCFTYANQQNFPQDLAQALKTIVLFFLQSSSNINDDSFPNRYETLLLTMNKLNGLLSSILSDLLEDIQAQRCNITLQLLVSLKILIKDHFQRSKGTDEDTTLQSQTENAMISLHSYMKKLKFGKENHCLSTAAEALCTEIDLLVE